MDRMSMAVRGVYTTESAKMTLATPGPRTAISAMASRIAAPTTTVRWATRRWSHPGRCTSSRAVMRASVATAASLIADARIDERVDHVHHQVDEHVRGRGRQHHALHDRIVAAQDGRDDEPAEPGDMKDDLGHDRAADQHGHGDAEHGDDRDQGVTA